MAPAIAAPRLRLLSYMVGGFPLELFELIAAVLDCDLDIDESRSGPAPGDDPFNDGRADLGWVCSTSFVDLSTRGSSSSIELAGVAWVPHESAGVDGQPLYFGDLVVRSGSGIASLADLRGRAVGCNDTVSLSGHVALLIALSDIGLVADVDLDLQFTGAHRASIDAVVAGDLDAAVVDSVVRAQLRDRPDVAQLEVVARLGPWPTQPLVASRRLGGDHVRELASALVDSSTEPRMAAALEAASLDRFVHVTPDHYAPVRRAMSTLVLQ